MQIFKTFFEFVTELDKKLPWGDPCVRPVCGIQLGRTKLEAYSPRCFIKMRRISEKAAQDLLPISLFSYIGFNRYEHSDSYPVRIRLYYTDTDLDKIYFSPDNWNIKLAERKGIQTAIVHLKDYHYPYIFGPDSRYTRIFHPGKICDKTRGHIFRSPSEYAYYADKDGMAALKEMHESLKAKYGFELPDLLVDECVWEKCAAVYKEGMVFVNRKDWRKITPEFEFGWNAETYVMVEKRFLDFPGLNFLRNPKKYPEEVEAIMFALQHPELVKIELLQQA